MTLGKSHGPPRGGAILEILAVDWERLRRTARASAPGDDALLVAEVIRRGVAIDAEGEPPMRLEDGSDPSARPLDAIRRLFVWRAANLGVLRFYLLTNRERFEQITAAEDSRYREKIELDLEVVPPLKRKARDLRAEVRRLEGQLRERGIDPDHIEPTIDRDRTLAVDAYVNPEYETNEARRAKAIEVFRRLGG